MASFFKQPQAAAQEDPEVTRLRNEEQKRAEEDRLRATQDQLRTETRFRSRSSSFSSLFGLSGASNRIRSLLGAG